MIDELAQASKEIEQNLPQGLFTPTLRIQIQGGGAFFAHDNIEKLSSKVAHNRPKLFFSTALSCPYGQKLKIHIGNWAEHPLLYLLCDFTYCQVLYLLE